MFLFLDGKLRETENVIVKLFWFLNYYHLITAEADYSSRCTSKFINTFQLS